MAEIMTVVNTTNREVSVLWLGERLKMAPFEEMSAVSEVAQRFLEVHPNAVQVSNITDIFGEVASDMRPTMIWLANVTGNADAPEHLKTTLFDKRLGHMVEVQMPNPFKLPKTFSEQLKGAEKIFKNRDGVEVSEYENSIPIMIPPFKLKEVPEHIGKWILSRAMNSAVEGHVAIIKSRELPLFRPNLDWDVDDIRVYLSLMEAVDWTDKEKFGWSNAQIKATNALPAMAVMRLHESRMLLLKRCFFCQANPAIKLPTEAEFEEAKIRRAEGKRPLLKSDAATIAEAEKALV